MGSVTQAVAINLPPLLFVTFQNEYGLTLERLGFLTTANFVLQMVVDLVASRFGNRMNFRFSSVLATAAATLGFLALVVLPGWLPDPFAALLLATVLLSLGEGLIEVVVTPVLDAIPEKSPGAISLLHSFYCWGSMSVSLLSTLFFVLCRVTRWRWLVLLWGLVPLTTTLLFLFVPMPTPKSGAVIAGEESRRNPLGQLLRRRVFWMLMLLMVCAGVAELSISNWASLFAEAGLQVSKTTGDLLGPCLFAFLMGVARVVLSRIKNMKQLYSRLFFCAVGCVGGYLLTVFAPTPLLSLLGIGVCGFCVGIMWPGVLSLATDLFPRAGTGMFACLALCGDIGCSVGPLLVGVISQNMTAGGTDTLAALQGGLLVVAIFPLVMSIVTRLLRRESRRMASAEKGR